ncbi:MAG: hypothetical protein RLZZ230_57 [Candidatus Parcubacteria bacterium]|jgi:LPXTG-site transpeptidase (sortase) family protein
MDYILQQIWERKFVFLGTFFIVFTLSYVALVAIDFVPEPPATNESEEATSTALVSSETKTEFPLTIVSPVITKVEASTTENQYELPLTINIVKLNKKVSVANPTSRAIADLDAALLNGVVRHPDSAELGQAGNVFILGHSSYLPTVFNKNFQAFNGIQSLEWGDVVEVYSDESVYEYRVDKVYRAKAQDLTVPIAGAEKRLTLATCNSFGSTDDRYIVEAEQIEVRKL